MLNVGLTGNVAAGKSTVSALFARWGATLIDADDIVHELQAPGQPLTLRIEQTFGPKAIRADGSLDRAWLRRRILEDPAARETLNRLVHPAVHQERQKRMAAARDRGDCIVLNDIPLLFEVMDPANFDVIVLVDAAPPERTRRLIQRGLDRAAAETLIGTQMDASAKRKRADYVIDNDGSMQDLQSRCAEVWQILRKRAAATPGAEGQRLLALFSGPDDIRRMGGTLARYAEAGTVIRLLWCPNGSEANHSIDVRQLGESLGTPDAESVEGAEITAAIDAFGPNLILSGGSAELESALHRRGLAKHGRTYRAVTDATEAQVTIDIRPWAERKRRALSLFGPEHLGDQRADFSWEWFGNSDRPATVLRGLF